MITLLLIYNTSQKRIYYNSTAVTEFWHLFHADVNQTVDSFFWEAVYVLQENRISFRLLVIYNANTYVIEAFIWKDTRHCDGRITNNSLILKYMTYLTKMWKVSFYSVRQKCTDQFKINYIKCFIRIYWTISDCLTFPLDKIFFKVALKM